MQNHTSKFNRESLLKVMEELKKKKAAGCKIDSVDLKKIVEIQRGLTGESAAGNHVSPMRDQDAADLRSEPEDDDQIDGDIDIVDSGRDARLARSPRVQEIDSPHEKRWKLEVNEVKGRAASTGTLNFTWHVSSTMHSY
jgi:hypothetical protein